MHHDCLVKGRFSTSFMPLLKSVECVSYLSTMTQQSCLRSIDRLRMLSAWLHHALRTFFHVKTPPLETPVVEVQMAALGNTFLQ